MRGVQAKQDATKPADSQDARSAGNVKMPADHIVGAVQKARKSREVNIPKYSVHSEVDYPNIGMSDCKEVFQLFGLEEARFFKNVNTRKNSLVDIPLRTIRQNARNLAKNSIAPANQATLPNVAYTDTPETLNPPSSSSE